MLVPKRTLLPPTNHMTSLVVPTEKIEIQLKTSYFEENQRK